MNLTLKFIAEEISQISLWEITRILFAVSFFLLNKETKGGLCQSSAPPWQCSSQVSVTGQVNKKHTPTHPSPAYYHMAPKNHINFLFIEKGIRARDLPHTRRFCIVLMSLEPGARRAKFSSVADTASSCVTVYLPFGDLC